MKLKLAWRNLQRNLRRSISTGMAICVGFVALNLLGAYILRSFETLRVTSVYMDQKGHIQIRKKGSVEGFEAKPKKFIISKAEQDEIYQKLFQVVKDQTEYTGRVLSAAGLLSNGVKSHPIYASGFDNESYIRSLKHPLMLEHGYFFMMDWQREHADDFLKNRELIAITPLISEIMNFQQPLESNPSVQIAGMTLEGDLNAINADLGALHSTGAEFLEATVIFTSIAKIQELLATDGVQALTLFLKSFHQIDDVHQALQKASQELSFPVEIFNYDSPIINDYFEGSMGFLYVMGGFFLVLICTAVSLTIINSLTMGIIERTREIGALRAIGFKRDDVQKLFVLESLLISSLAVFLGTFFSKIISDIVNHSGITFEPPGTPNEIPFTLLWNFSIAMGVAIVLILVTYISSTIVIRRKLKSQLISLLHDTE